LGQVISPGTPLVLLQPLSPLYVRLSQPEQEEESPPRASLAVVVNQ
jgi:hypothetical protein